MADKQGVAWVPMDTSTISLVSSDGKLFPIVMGLPTRVGRGNDNDLVIPDRSVSHHHAIITIKDGHCIVRDLESANGTFLADRKISDARLAAGDRVRFGNVEFKLDSPGARISGARPWWQSRLIAGSAALATGLVLFTGMHHRPNVDQVQPSGAVISPLAGSNFSLPQVSTDFVGNWSGVIPMTFSNPPNFSRSASIDQGATFYVTNGSVVMSVNFYVGAGVKLTKLTARGVDQDHVMLEAEMLEKDTLGQPLWERDRIQIALVSSSQIDCTETVEYVRDPNGPTVARVFYRGPLWRISEAERLREAKEIERKGQKKQGEIRIPVVSR